MEQSSSFSVRNLRITVINAQFLAFNLARFSQDRPVTLVQVVADLLRDVALNVYVKAGSSHMLCFYLYLRLT